MNKKSKPIQMVQYIKYQPTNGYNLDFMIDFAEKFHKGILFHNKLETPALAQKLGNNNIQYQFLKAADLDAALTLDYACEADSKKPIYFGFDDTHPIVKIRPGYAAKNIDNAIALANKYTQTIYISPYNFCNKKGDVTIFKYTHLKALQTLNAGKFRVFNLNKFSESLNPTVKKKIAMPAIRNTLLGDAIYLNNLNDQKLDHYLENSTVLTLPKIRHEIKTALSKDKNLSSRFLLHSFMDSGFLRMKKGEKAFIDEVYIWSQMKKIKENIDIGNDINIRGYEDVFDL